MPLQSGEIRPKLGASRLSIYLRRMPFSSKPAAAPRGKSPTGRTIPAPLAAELLRLSNGERWGLDVSQFSVILESISVKYLPEDCNDAECKSMLKELKLEELALARACAAGNENAWTEFLTRYRERLYGAALSIAKDSSRARDLADGLYAELYGLKTRDGGGRVSKLEYYSGRGSLEGWLRTILSQNYINEFRSRRNQDSLDEEEEQGSQFAAPAPELPNPHLGAVNKVLETMLGELDSESRTLLAMYYLDGQKLAKIAQVWGVHESTVSRKLDRLTKELRKRMLRGLEERGLSRQAAQEAMETDIRDIDTPLVAKLKTDSTQDSQSGAFLMVGREPAPERQSEK